MEHYPDFEKKIVLQDFKLKISKKSKQRQPIVPEVAFLFHYTQPRKRHLKPLYS